MTWKTGRRETPRPLGGLLAALFVGGLVSCCSTTTGVYHRVEQGQTAYRIAKAYDIDARDLLEANGIDDPRALQPGQRLWIPGASSLRDVPRLEEFRDIRSRLTGKRFVMPVSGTISSGFGSRNGRRHDGIDILAPGGTAVRAASYGVVVYAGDGLRGYGNAIILDHGDGVTTLYGHLRGFRVQSGDVVAEGSVIGSVGDTGNATTTHLHFELRLEGEGLDPERYLEETENPQ